MSDKRTVVGTFDKLAFALELLGGQERAARVYANAAWALRSVEGDFVEAYRSGRLAELRGVGRSTLAVVGTVLDGGTPALLADLQDRVPEGLWAVRRVRGLGPKKVAQLWHELDITTLGELEYACNENRLVDLKGFGAKTQAKVLVEIARLRQYEGLFRRDALRLAEEAARAALGELTVVGEVRRGHEVTRVLEVVVTGPGAGEVPSEVEGVPLVVHATGAEQLGHALVWHTGSDAHLERLAARASELGLRLDDDGLHDARGTVPCPDEDALYAALDLHPSPPERREPGQPLWPRTHSAPRLMRLDDLQGALHNHTTRSDGIATAAAMRAAASQLGLRWLGISDHSRTAGYAGGLQVDEIDAQLTELAALNADGAPCRLVTGIESDILADGSLDYPPDVLARLELVIASVHSRHGQDPAAMTARMVAAARDPYTAVVGHPTGRLLLGRPPSEYDVEALLDACAAAGTAIELNASPHRLDLCTAHLELARERGVKVSIAADAHSPSALANLAYGVVIARAAGLRPDEVLNCLSAGDVIAWERDRRSAAGV